MPEESLCAGSTRALRQDVAETAAAVRDLLRAELLRGDHDASALPDEASIQRAHGASRGAVRAALELLREEGLVERLRGAGTFVAARKTLHRLERLHGLDPAAGPVLHEVLTRQVLGAHSVLTDLLQVAPGAPVLRLDRRTRVGAEVVGVWTSYLPMSLASPLAEPSADLRGDYYDALERLLGRVIGHSELVTEAVFADGAVAPALGVPLGAPVLRLERVVFLADGTPLDVGVGRFRGDRMRLSSTRHREQKLQRRGSS